LFAAGFVDQEVIRTLALEQVVVVEFVVVDSSERGTLLGLAALVLYLGFPHFKDLEVDGEQVVELLQILAC